MREVVLDAVDLTGELLAREHLREKLSGVGALGAEADLLQHQLERRTRTDQVSKLAAEVGAGVLVECDVGNVRKSNACLVQTVADRFRRKTCPVLNATKALL